VSGIERSPAIAEPLVQFQVRAPLDHQIQVFREALCVAQFGGPHQTLLIVHR